MGISAAQLSRRFGVAPKTVFEWVKDECPRNPDKSFDEEKVLAWRKAKLSEIMNDPSVRAASARTTLQAKRLMLQCEKLETEIGKEKGKLHDKDACAASLLEIRAIESRTLHGLGAKVASQFPEVPGLKAAIEKETDAIVERLKK